jgi:PAS domain S-box-containing protein
LDIYIIMESKYYIKIFEQSPESIVVIDTSFAILAISDSFLKATDKVRENIKRLNIFDVFPDNPDDKTANGENIVRASFNLVIKNRTKDTLPAGRYDIQKSEGDGFERRYWQATSSPILDDNNKVKYIIHRTDDITEQVIAKKKIIKSEKRFEIAIEAVEGVLWTNDALGKMVGEQPGWASITGQSYEEYQGFGWVKAIHPDDA